MTHAQNFAIRAENAIEAADRYQRFGHKRQGLEKLQLVGRAEEANADVGSAWIAGLTTHLGVDLALPDGVSVLDPRQFAVAKRDAMNQKGPVAHFARDLVLPNKPHVWSPASGWLTDSWFRWRLEQIDMSAGQPRSLSDPMRRQARSGLLRLRAVGYVFLVGVRATNQNSVQLASLALTAMADPP